MPSTSICVMRLCACVLKRRDDLNQLITNSIAKQWKTKTYKQTRELRTGFEPVIWMCERPTTARAFNRFLSGTAIQVVRYKFCQNSGRDYMCNVELKKKSYINMCPIIRRYITVNILIFQIHTYDSGVSALKNTHAYSHLSNTTAAQISSRTQRPVHTRGWRSSQTGNGVTTTQIWTFFWCSHQTYFSFSIATQLRK